MLDAKDYPPGTPVYSFVDRQGVNWHIDSNKLRVWCLEHWPEIFNIPVDRATARNYILENVVDVAHVKRVMLMKQWDPLIFGKFGTITNGRPDVMHIDGHHRYVAAAALGMDMAKGFVLEKAQWEPFQIQGLDDITEAFLRAVPPRGQHKAIK